MSTSLFSANSAAFPRAAHTRQSALPGASKLALPQVHSPSNLRSNGVVMASACLDVPHSAERCGGWR
jgi:hypothetical protein